MSKIGIMKNRWLIIIGSWVPVLGFWLFPKRIWADRSLRLHPHGIEVILNGMWMGWSLMEVIVLGLSLWTI